jgi:protein-tyrosine-phosphatase
MIERADIILVMEPYHRDFIIRLVPESRSKVFYLRQFSQDPADDIIPDPIGRGVDFYKQVKDIITDSLEGFIKWVKNLK